MRGARGFLFRVNLTGYGMTTARTRFRDNSHMDVLTGLRYDGPIPFRATPFLDFCFWHDDPLLVLRHLAKSPGYLGLRLVKLRPELPGLVTADFPTTLDLDFHGDLPSQKKKPVPPLQR